MKNLPMKVEKDNIIFECYIVVDKHDNAQGLDQIRSGGYPFIALSPSNVRFWGLNQKEEVERYCKVINWGDKGYRVRKVRLELIED